MGGCWRGRGVRVPRRRWSGLCSSCGHDLLPCLLFRDEPPPPPHHLWPTASPAPSFCQSSPSLPVLSDSTPARTCPPHPRCIHAVAPSKTHCTQHPHAHRKPQSRKPADPHSHHPAPSLLHPAPSPPRPRPFPSAAPPDRPVKDYWPAPSSHSPVPVSQTQATRSRQLGTSPRCKVWCRARTRRQSGVWRCEAGCARPSYPWSSR